MSNSWQNFAITTASRNIIDCDVSAAVVMRYTTDHWYPLSQGYGAPQAAHSPFGWQKEEYWEKTDEKQFEAISQKLSDGFECKAQANMS